MNRPSFRRFYMKYRDFSAYVIVAILLGATITAALIVLAEIHG